MEGVRRWMGVQPHVNRRRSRNKSRRRPEAKEADERPAQWNDPYSTEYIVAQLTDPTVPESEVAEYQGCVCHSCLGYASNVQPKNPHCTGTSTNAKNSWKRVMVLIGATWKFITQPFGRPSETDRIGWMIYPMKRLFLILSDPRQHFLTILLGKRLFLWLTIMKNMKNGLGHGLCRNWLVLIPLLSVCHQIIVILSSHIFYYTCHNIFRMGSSLEVPGITGLFVLGFDAFLSEKKIVKSNS